MNPKRPAIPIFPSATDKMSIAEIAEFWGRELDEPRTLIERELVLWHHPRWLRQQGYTEDESADVMRRDAEYHDIPTMAKNGMMTRDETREFCQERKRPLPSFWFGPEQHEPSFPGRPSLMSDIKRELELRADAGEMLSTLSAESQELEKYTVWLGASADGVATARCIRAN